MTDAVASAPPHDADAERTVLGAVLIDNAAFDSAARLTCDDFHRDAHRALWAAMQGLHERRQPIDTVTLTAALRQRQQLETVGGAAYIGAMLDGVPRVTNVEPWCRIIREKAALRRLAAIGQRLTQQALAADVGPDDLISRVDAALLKLGAGLSSSVGPRPLTDGLPGALEAIERRLAHSGLHGYSTGLWELDQLLGGIRPGRMGVIGARLGSGKSILGLQVASAICEQASEQAVLVSSLEMDVVELAERRLAATASVDPTWLHMAAPQDREARMARLAAAWGKIPRNLLVLEDAYTVADLRAHARQVQAQRGLAAVVVDYVGLMDAPADRGAREWEKVATLSKALRRMAAELNVPIIVVAQLNREPEGGGKRRPPTMADLAGSDALGRDCHWCVLIDLEPPALKGQDPQSTRDVADLYLRKNRGGRKGSVRVYADLALATFRTLEA